jgi:hypothetical protein
MIGRCKRIGPESRPKLILRRNYDSDDRIRCRILAIRTLDQGPDFGKNRIQYFGKNLNHLALANFVS